MTGIPLDDLPDVARTAWLMLRDELERILGDDLVAMWAHGGTTSAERAPMGDLDTYVILARAPDALAAQRIEGAQEAIARDLGIDWDAWYVLADDARCTDPPHHAFDSERRDTSWAIHRSHWLAGRYVCLHGPRPSEIVIPPAWPEVEAELDRELEHLERHVVEGDTDPYEATYAILNGSRILHAVGGHGVAISKRDAGAWGLEHLPDRWHPAIRAALRSHGGSATDGDADLLAAEMSAFVAFVRDGLPATDDRPQDAPPRWSGY